MQLVLILLVIAGGMGLSVEAGLLGPLGGKVGDLWATFSIFGVGAALTFLLMLFFSPRIQCGVVLNKPTHDRGQSAHGSHPGCKQRGVIAYLKLTQLTLFVQVCANLFFITHKYQ